MFTWDQNKNEINIEKHEISFEEAKALWDSPRQIRVNARSTESETRFALISELNGKVWAAFFTERGGAIRIISVRRARPNEVELLNG